MSASLEVVDRHDDLGKFFRNERRGYGILLQFALDPGDAIRVDVFFLGIKSAVA